MSDSEQPTHDNEVVDYLLDNGPVASSEVPGKVERTEKMHGVARFKLDGRTQGRDVGIKSKPESVVYLYPVHSKTQVAVAWVSANRDLLKGRRETLMLVSKSLGSEWNEPFKTALYDAGVQR